MASTIRAKAPKVNKDWFTKKMEDRDLSMRGLAKLLRLDVAAISLMLNGKRRMQTAEAVEIARHLRVTVAEVLANAGVAVDGGGASRKVPVVGWMDGERAAEIEWDAHGDLIEGPPDLPRNAVAVQVRCAAGVRDGELIFLSAPGDGVPAEAIGRKCLVCLKDGTHSLRYVRRGYKSGRFNLLVDGGIPVTDAELKWATPVFWIKSA